MVSLSFDVIELIIDELRHDRASLYQCSLVARSLLLPARRHLFSTIELFNEDICARFYRLLIRRTTIKRYVRHLTLDIIGTEDLPISRILRHYNILDHSGTSSHFRIIGSILKMVGPNLLTFKFSGGVVRYFGIFPPAFQLVLVGLLELNKLTSLHFTELDDFPIHCITRCSSLKTLILQRFRSDNYDIPQLNFEVARIDANKGELEHLSISGCTSLFVPVLRDPRSRLGLGSLHRLHLDCMGGTGNFWELLREGQASLQFLTCSWVPWFYHETPQTVYFGEMLNVESLVLSTLYHHHQRPSWLATSLRHGTGLHSLESLLIWIECTVSLESLPRDPLWPAIDSALTHPRYSRLRCVNITIAPMYLHDDISRYAEHMEVILSLMPKLEYAGILHLDIGYDRPIVF